MARRALFLLFAVLLLGSFLVATSSSKRVVADSPCQQNTMIQTALNITSAGTTLLTVGSPIQATFICSVVGTYSGTGATVQFEYGNGSGVCTSGTVLLSGPIPLPATTKHFRYSSPFGAIYKAPQNPATPHNICLVVTGSPVSVTGAVYYVYAPGEPIATPSPSPTASPSPTPSPTIVPTPSPTPPCVLPNVVQAINSLNGGITTFAAAPSNGNVVAIFGQSSNSGPTSVKDSNGVALTQRALTGDATTHFVWVYDYQVTGSPNQNYTCTPNAPATCNVQAGMEISAVSYPGTYNANFSDGGTATASLTNISNDIFLGTGSNNNATSFSFTGVSAINTLFNNTAVAELWGVANSTSSTMSGAGAGAGAAVAVADYTLGGSCVSPSPSPSPTASPTPTPTPSPTTAAFFALVQSFNPTFYYRLDDSGAGLTAVDSSANNLTGSYAASGVTYGLSGITAASDNDSAVLFSSTAGGMKTGLVGSSAITSGTHAWTASVAVNSSVVGAGGFTTFWGNYATMSGSGNGLVFAWDNAGGGEYCLYAFFSKVCYTSGTWLQGWHVWTLVDQGGGPPTTVNIYLDGNTTPVGTGTISNSINTSTCNLAMGANYQNTCASGFNFFTNAIFDEFFLLPTAWTPTQVNTAYTTENTPVTPAPTPSPLGPPVSGPFAGNAKAALCVNSQTFLNVFPTNPPGFGTASGDFAGEFEDSGYTRALLSNFWGATSTRVGTIGNNLSGTAGNITTLASLLTIPAPGGSVSFTVSSASGTANEVVQVGVSSWQTSQNYSASVNDPMTLIGTLTAGAGTTAWTLSNVWAQSSVEPASGNTTIPITSPAYGTATKIYGPITFATWPGFTISFGRINGGYDSYNGDSTDGTGQDPFAITNDVGVTGSPQSLQIKAFPMPTGLQFPHESNVSNADSFTATSLTTASVTLPAQGGSLSFNVSNPASAQNDWFVGFGSPGQGVIAYGFLASGGNDHNSGTGAANPWKIVDLQFAAGSTGGGQVFNSGANLVVWNWRSFFAGVLDKNVQQEYGVYQANIRVPTMTIGNSPAFWCLQTQAGYNVTWQALGRNECDVQEMFANSYAATNGMNAGNLLWNSASGSGVQAYWCGLNCAANGLGQSGATGVYSWPSWEPTTPNGGYHTYAQLWLPGGGTSFPVPPYTQNGYPITCNFPTTAGDSMFLDGFQNPGHLGCADLTQGVYDKELMSVYQIGQTTSSLSPETAVDTTNGSFVIPSTVYGTTVVVTATNAANWIQEAGKLYDIYTPSGCNPNTISSCTTLMHGMLISWSGNSLTFYVGAENSPASNLGSTMPSGSIIAAHQGAFSQPPGNWPQSYWINWVRFFAPPLPPATPAPC